MAKRKARRTMNAKAKKKSAPRRQSRSRRPARTRASATLRGSQTRRRAKKSARKAAKTAPPRQAKGRTAARKRPAGKASRPKPPTLQRERRRLSEEPITASVPSSLNFDRSASSAKSGRNAMLQHRREHTEAGPVMTGGDIDADWEDGYSEGDEAPGGDNPTPDQDVVEEIGRALGVEYEDSEELKGADKISKRDANRWEYDPASSEDYGDRNKKQ